jgi:hypothetical protein
MPRQQILASTTLSMTGTPITAILTSGSVAEHYSSGSVADHDSGQTTLCTELPYKPGFKKQITQQR